MAFFGRCLAIDPSHPGYRIKLAAAMNKAGDFEGAARTLERGTVLDPDDAHLHLKLAQQYQMMGREMDFEREFQKFNELSDGKGRCDSGLRKFRRITTCRRALSGSISID